MQTVASKLPLTLGVARGALWLVAFWFVAIAIVLYLLGGDEVTRLAGSAAGLIVCGLMFAFYGDDDFDLFSPAFFWGINFVIFYGIAALLPFFLPPEEASFISLFGRAKVYYPQATLTSFLCLLGLMAGYRSKLGVQLSSKVNWFARTGTARAGKIYWFVLMLMGVFSYILLISSGAYFQASEEIVATPLLYSAAGFLHVGMLVAAPYALVRALQSDSNIFWKSAAISSVAIIFLVGLPSGSKTMALMGLIILAFAWNFARVRFNRKIAAIGIISLLLLLMALTPFNAVYRGISLVGGKDAGFSGSFAMMVDSIGDMQNTDIDELVDISINYTAQRLSNISIVSIILERQNAELELSLGGTYALFIYTFIPRFLWEEKPGLTIGREVAVELKLGAVQGTLLGKAVSNTSVGITFVGEAVYNFSAYIAPLFMYFMGLFYRWLYEVFKYRGKGDRALLAGTAYMVWYGLVFTAHESNFAAAIAGAIKFVLFLLLLQSLLKFKKRLA